MSRQPYPSDLSDVEWQLIKPLLPPAKSDSGRGRKRTVDLREVLNAIFFWLRAGCAWDLLPHDFPPSETVYSYWRKWQKKGVWEHINATL
ncbi:MAG: transposase [Synechococcaceae cyanobacterium SM2_3_1]|nr:transposase [Synechococcaceae cyanobacterium SM2_3_1]